MIEMKVRMKYNLLKKVPDVVTIESDDIDVICTVIRAIFHETHGMVVAETNDNIAWIQGPTDTILIAPQAEDEKKSDD